MVWLFLERGMFTTIGVTHLSEELGGTSIDQIACRTAFSRISMRLRLQNIKFPKTRSPQRQQNAIPTGRSERFIHGCVNVQLRKSYVYDWGSTPC